MGATSGGPVAAPRHLAKELQSRRALEAAILGEKAPPGPLLFAASVGSSGAGECPF